MMDEQTAIAAPASHAANTFVVPNRSAWRNPNSVIDPTCVKDSTAGLQAFINRTPPGADITLLWDLRKEGPVVLDGRILRTVEPVEHRKQLIATDPYPWRVVPDLREKLPNGQPNPYYNPDGICAPWLMDLTGSLKNPYGRPDNKEACIGGFDGTTGASGVDYDGLHLSTRLTSPFLPTHRGKAVRVLVNKITGEGFSQIISDVDADGRTVRWVDRENVATHEDSTHTVAWCIEPKLGWKCEFQPNPEHKPYYTGGDWHGYDLALRKACFRNMAPRGIDARHGAHVIGIDIVGPNKDSKASVLNYDQSWPAVSEFQHGIAVDATSSAIFCHVHHVFGDGFWGAGLLYACRMDHCGRCGTTANDDNKRIDHCVIELTHLAAIDFETSKTLSGVQITDLTLGGGNGISITAPVEDLLLSNIHSTQEDVDNGTISSLCQFMRGKKHCSEGSKNVTYEKIVFDKKTTNLIVVANVDGLHVHGCKGNLTGAVVKTYTRPDRADACTNLDIDGNEGGVGESAT